jgi:hypothetical protein
MNLRHRSKDLIIASDVDGCVVNVVDPVLDEVNRVVIGLGLPPYTVDDFDDFWWASKIIKELTGNKRLATQVESGFFNPKIQRRAQPYPGAIETWSLIHELKERKIIRDYYFITSRPPELRRAILNGLESICLL